MQKFYKSLSALEEHLNALKEKDMPNINDIEVRLIQMIHGFSVQTDEEKIADVFYGTRNSHINTLRLVHYCNPDRSKGRSDVQMEVTSSEFFSADRNITEAGTPDELTQVVMDTIAWNYDTCPRPAALQQSLADQDMDDNIVYIENLLGAVESNVTILEFIQYIEAPKNKFQATAANVMRVLLEVSWYAQSAYSYDSALKTIRKGLDSLMEDNMFDPADEDCMQVKLLSDIIDYLFWNDDIPQKGEHVIKSTVTDHHWCEPYIRKALQERGIESITVCLDTAKTNLLEQIKIYEPQKAKLGQEIVEIIDCMGLLFSNVKWKDIEIAANNIQNSFQEYVNTVYKRLLTEDECEVVRQSIEDYIFRINDDIYNARLLTMCIFLFCVYYAQQFSSVKEEQRDSKTVNEQTTTFSFMKQNKSLFIPLWGRDAQKGSKRAKACERLYCDIYDALTQASVSNLIRREKDRVQEFIPMLPLLRNNRCNLFEFSPMICPELIADEICVDLDLPEESARSMAGTGDITYIL